MAEQVKIFWVNLAVGVLGLLVGSSYLLKDVSSTQNLVFGTICIILATGWLVYVFLSKKRSTKTS